MFREWRFPLKVIKVYISCEIYGSYKNLIFESYNKLLQCRKFKYYVIHHYLLDAGPCLPLVKIKEFVRKSKFCHQNSL